MAERVIHAGVIHLRGGDGLETFYHVTATKSRVTIHATRDGAIVGKRWNSQVFSDAKRCARLYLALTSGMGREEKCQILTHTF